MSELFNVSKLHSARTENGAVAHSSTLSACVDFYVAAGSSRNHVENAVRGFLHAVKEDLDIAVRTLLHMRDIREGMGERNAFRAVLKTVIEQNLLTDHEIQRVMHRIPELGRFDDLFVFFDTRFESVMFDMLVHALTVTDTQALVAKWMPRRKGGKNGKNKLFVHRFCKHTGLSRQEYQKVMADMSNAIEQNICAKEFDKIDYNKVPSVAAARYQRLFTKHDEQRYKAWVNELTNPQAIRSAEVKVNAGAVYPYDIIRSLRHGNPHVAQAQWDALPDFLNGSDENILCISDVSGSMTCEHFGTVDALDIGLSLTMYCAERNTGIFKDKAMVYSTNPFFVDLSGGLRERMQQLMSHVEYGSTNFQKVFDRILELATKHNLSQADLPSKVIVFSDMQFDCVSGDMTNFETIRNKFEKAGYAMPKMVFWHLTSRKETKEATVRDRDVAMVSGFSPSTMKAVLGGDDFTPVGVMKKAVMIPRYDW